MKQPWFRQKTAPGWGVAPASWQGWALTLGCLLGGMALVRWLQPGLGPWAVVGFLPTLTLLFAAMGVSAARQGWKSLQRKPDDR